MSNEGPQTADELAGMVARLRETQAALERLLNERTSALERARHEIEDRAAAQMRLERDYTRAVDRLHTLIRNIPGAVYRCANDPAWTMEFISDQITEMSGYPASDFLFNSRRSYASIIHPDDLFLVAASVNKGVSHHRPYIIDYRIIHADGGVHWVHERGQGHFAEDGTLLWLDGVIMDITDRVPASGHEPAR